MHAYTHTHICLNVLCIYWTERLEEFTTKYEWTELWMYYKYGNLHSKKELNFTESVVQYLFIIYGWLVNWTPQDTKLKHDNFTLELNLNI